MSLTRSAGALAALIGLAISCAEPPTLDPVVDCPAIHGRATTATYGGPGDFPLFACSAGGMADFDLVPPYMLSGDSVFGGMVRLGRSCGVLTTPRAARVDAGDDFVYWSTPEEASLICRGEDGDLVGWVASCNPVECLVVEVWVDALGWPEDEAEASGLSFVSELAGPESSSTQREAIDVRVKDGIAYLLRPDGILLVDAGVPGAPRELAWIARPLDSYNDIDVYDGSDGRRYAVATGGGARVFYDVSDPRQPREVRRMVSGGHTVFTETVQGRTRADFTWRSSELHILDVSRPREAEPIGRWAGDFHDLQVIDQVGYLNRAGAGFEVVDFSEPANPVRLGALADVGYSHATAVTTAAGRRIAVHGRRRPGDRPPVRGR